MTERDPERAPVGPELERRLREAMGRAHAAQTEADATDAPTPERLHDALAGRLPEDERVAVIDAAMRSARGRRELATVRTALAAARDAWPSDGARSWWRRPALAIAATALLAAGVGGGAWWRASRPSGASVDDPFRGSVRTGVTLVTPAMNARAADSVRLVWRAVPDAAGYDVEVLNADGTPLLTTSTSDTTLALAPSTLSAGMTVEWWVRARLLDGTTRRSPVGRILRP